MKLIELISDEVHSRNGLNLKYVCDSAGVSYSAVRNALAENKEVREGTLIKLLEFLEMDFLLIKKDFKVLINEQDFTILTHFLKNKTKEMTARDVWNQLFDTNKVPLPSIRRSMTNLTNDNHLVQLPEKVKDHNSKLVLAWKLNLS